MRHLRYFFVTCAALALFFGGAAALTNPAWTAGKAPAKLRKARVAAAAKAFALHAARHRAGQGLLDDVYRWSRRWRESGGGSAATAAHLGRMKKLAAAVKGQVSAGSAPSSDAAAMRYYVAEAEVWAAGGR